MLLSSALLLVSAIVTPISAQLFQNDPDATPRNMNVTVDVTFPDDVPATEALQNMPTVIVNGIPKKVNVAVVNHEEETIGIQFLGGSLWDLETNTNVRNLTQQVLRLDLPKGQKVDLPYTILVDMHPKDLRLNLQMVLSAEQKLETVTAYSSTVSIVEQPMSLLDPQLLFLYLVLLSSIAGVGYWAYNYWLDTVNPKRRRTPRAAAVKPVRAESPVGTATGVEGQRFDESWIPAHHIKSATSQKARGKAAK